MKSNDSGTTFDETLRQLKHDTNALNNHIVDLLETQMNGNLKDEIVHYRKIQALFPIISILFNDQTKVEIFIQVRINKEHSQDKSNFQEPIHGVRKTKDHHKSIHRVKVLNGACSSFNELNLIFNNDL
jgi:hypothetical protein